MKYSVVVLIVGLLCAFANPDVHGTPPPPELPFEPPGRK